MHPRFKNWPGTKDAKWFEISKGLDLPETYWAEFIAEYRPMWDYWQKEYRAFDSAPHLIWDEGCTPDYREDFQQPNPSLGLRTHNGEPRPMVLICPGGGWMWKASYEGTIVAERFYKEGFNVAVLDYRVKPYTLKCSYLDAIRAVRYLRCHADEFNTFPNKIAMMGFSAGAFMAGWCATMFDEGQNNSVDVVERCSSRPDAVVLCYGAGSNICSSRGLLYYDRKLQVAASKNAIEYNIRDSCPPFFIWQCAGQDDPRNATQLANVLAAVGVPFELHIFPYGNHGMALANELHPDPKANDSHVAHWVTMCCEWLHKELI